MRPSLEQLTYEGLLVLQQVLSSEDKWLSTRLYYEAVDADGARVSVAHPQATRFTLLGAVEKAAWVLHEQHPGHLSVGSLVNGMYEALRAVLHQRLVSAPMLPRWAAQRSRTFEEVRTLIQEGTEYARRKWEKQEKSNGG